MSSTGTANSSAVFKAHNVVYAMEKIGDFFRGTGSGILAGWPGTSAKIIVEALEELGANIGKAGMTAEATALPVRWRRFSTFHCCSRAPIFHKQIFSSTFDAGAAATDRC